MARKKSADERAVALKAKAQTRIQKARQLLKTAGHELWEVQDLRFKLVQNLNDADSSVVEDAIHELINADRSADILDDALATLDRIL